MLESRKINFIIDYFYISFLIILFRSQEKSFQERYIQFFALNMNFIIQINVQSNVLFMTDFFVIPIIFFFYNRTIPEEICKTDKQNPWC